MKTLILQHEKREFREATDVSWAQVQNRDARKAPPTAVPTLAAAAELLLLTFYLSGNSGGYKMSSQVEICSH